MIYKYSQLSKNNVITYEEAIDLCFNEKEGPQNIYLGQLKLFFTELFFLTKCAKSGNKVLYVGAAPGYHTTMLADLFPDIDFDLWDPRKFETEERPNIRTYNDFFTDTSAKTYAEDGSNILFMVDMRTLKNINKIKKDTTKLDELVTEDMIMQRRWAQIIKPIYAYLKFRLPYEDTFIKYLTGEIYLQPYAPLSTETRLLTNDYFTEKKYDTKLFNDQLSYHNYHNRCKKQSYRKYAKIMEKYNLVNNWDNELALSITHFYLKKIKNVTSKEVTGELFMEIISFHEKKYGKKYDVIFNSLEGNQDTR